MRKKLLENEDANKDRFVRGGHIKPTSDKALTNTMKDSLNLITI